MQHLSFWITSLYKVMISSCIKFHTKILISFFFTAEYNFIVYVPHFLLTILQLTDRLISFPCLVNIAATHMNGQFLVVETKFFGQMPKSSLGCVFLFPINKNNEVYLFTVIRYYGLKVIFIYHQEFNNKFFSFMS